MTNLKKHQNALTLVLNVPQPLKMVPSGAGRFLQLCLYVRRNKHAVLACLAVRRVKHGGMRYKPFSITLRWNTEKKLLQYSLPDKVYFLVKVKGATPLEEDFLAFQAQLANMIKYCKLR